MRRRGSRPGRSGTTLVEAAIVLSVFLTLVLGGLDLGIGIFRSHLITNAARHGARQAVVRGALASSLGVWGPETIGPIPASDSHPLAQAIRPHLVGMDPAAITVQAEWLDGSNEPGKRVRVTVSGQYRPIFAYIFGDSPIPLEAASTMRVAH